MITIKISVTDNTGTHTEINTDNKPIPKKVPIPNKVPVPTSILQPIPELVFSIDVGTIKASFINQLVGVQGLARAL